MKCIIDDETLVEAFSALGIKGLSSYCGLSNKNPTPETETHLVDRELMYKVIDAEYEVKEIK